MTDPEGGFVLWITLPGSGDMDEVFRRSREKGVVFTPGSIFSLEGRWDNCLRLNAGLYSSIHEQSIRVLGGIINEVWDFGE